MLRSVSTPFFVHTHCTTVHYSRILFYVYMYLIAILLQSASTSKYVVVNNVFIFYSGAKRKHIMVSRMDDIGSGSTGLTQEIDIMDIGSSTPKRKKSKSPLKGVLKIRYVLYSIGTHWTIDVNSCIELCREYSDDEAPTNEHLNNANVMFSTPVSSLKAPRNSILKLKSTRFQLPSSEEKSRKNYDSTESAQRYVHVNSMSV